MKGWGPARIVTRRVGFLGKPRDSAGPRRVSGGRWQRRGEAAASPARGRNAYDPTNQSGRGGPPCPPVPRGNGALLQQGGHGGPPLPAPLNLETTLAGSPRLAAPCYHVRTPRAHGEPGARRERRSVTVRHVLCSAGRLLYYSLPRATSGRGTASALP